MLGRKGGELLAVDSLVADQIQVLRGLNAARVQVVNPAVLHFRPDLKQFLETDDLERFLRLLSLTSLAWYSWLVCDLDSSEGLSYSSKRGVGK